MPRGSGSGSGSGSGGGKPSPLSPPHVPMKPTTRSSGTISKAQFEKAVELGNKQPTENMPGGAGIPGSRKSTETVKLAKLNFKDIGGQTKAILDKSKAIHGRKDIVNIRAEVAPINRHVDYEPGTPGLGVHSLHVANDIAAVSNGKTHDYPKLAPKLDKRLSNSAPKDTYFKKSMTVEKRHEHVGKGLQHLIAGNPDQAKDAFKDAGLTKRGRKWAYKMGTLMLAEHGREVNGRNTGQVGAALDEIKSGKTFKEVFVKKADTLAPFAKRGGAKAFKKIP